ncbi:MAG: hypothetical protein K0R94_1205, partial [Burkholderiales bacterium]|nr:hypothetical protein [Burkholderiales bacterium]
PSSGFSSEITILTKQENWALWAPNFGNLSTGDAFYLPYSGHIGQDSCKNGVITLNINDAFKDTLVTIPQITLYQQNPRFPLPDPDKFLLNNAFAAPFQKYCDKFLLTGTWAGGRNINFSVTPVDCNFPTSTVQKLFK